MTQEGGKSTVQTQIGRLPVQTPFTGEVTILIRPDAMRLDGSGTHYIEGKVLEGSFRGATSRALIDVNGVVLTFEFLTSKRQPSAGEYVHLSFDPGEAILVYPNSDK